MLLHLYVIHVTLNNNEWVLYPFNITVCNLCVRDYASPSPTCGVEPCLILLRNDREDPTVIFLLPRSKVLQWSRNLFNWKKKKKKKKIEKYIVLLINWKRYISLIITKNYITLQFETKYNTLIPSYNLKIEDYKGKNLIY